MNLTTLRLKCNALLNMVNANQSVYEQATNVVERDYIETTFGAAGIFYLPEDKQLLWDGLISEQALVDNERSKEHIYPRKYSAKQLLTGQWVSEDYPNTVEGLMKYYIEVIGVYRYVTKKENKEVVKHQKSSEFISPDDTYEKAGIVFVKHP